MIEVTLGIAGFVIGLVALGIALWQVRDACRVSRLQAEITVIDAYLTAELIGRRREDILEARFQKLYRKACELAGSKEAVEKILCDIP